METVGSANFVAANGIVGVTVHWAFNRKRKQFRRSHSGQPLTSLQSLAREWISYHVQSLTADPQPLTPRNRSLHAAQRRQWSFLPSAGDRVFDEGDGIAALLTARLKDRLHRFHEATTGFTLSAVRQPPLGFDHRVGQ